MTAPSRVEIKTAGAVIFTEFQKKGLTPSQSELYAINMVSNSKSLDLFNREDIPMTGKSGRPTKNTVDSIRNKSHWNYENIIAKDPLRLGFCSEKDFNKIIAIHKEDKTLKDDEVQD